MNYQYTERGDINRDYGKEVDGLLRVRNAAKVDLIQSFNNLINMGAQVVVGDELFCVPSMNMERFFACNNQEFSWEAEYKDGTIIKQFDKKENHHYGHIDQSKLKIFRWVSNFDYPSANEEKRVIVSLDFETGEFSFMNGFVPQDVRGRLSRKYPTRFKPKLIMKMIKRTSPTMGTLNGVPEQEITYYNRYLIGWEHAPGSQIISKTIACIEPNGFVHMWDMG